MMLLHEVVSNAMDAVENRTGKLTESRFQIHLVRDLASAGIDQV